MAGLGRALKGGPFGTHKTYGAGRDSSGIGNRQRDEQRPRRGIWRGRCHVGTMSLRGVPEAGLALRASGGDRIGDVALAASALAGVAPRAQDHGDGSDTAGAVQHLDRTVIPQLLQTLGAIGAASYTVPSSPNL